MGRKYRAVNVGRSMRIAHDHFNSTGVLNEKCRHQDIGIYELTGLSHLVVSVICLCSHVWIPPEISVVFFLRSRAGALCAAL